MPPSDSEVITNEGSRHSLGREGKNREVVIEKVRGRDKGRVQE